MSTLKNFDEFLEEAKQYKAGNPDSEENKASFYEKAKLKDDQKKLVTALVDKASEEGNVNKGQNYKALILGKLAGLDDKQIEELEKNIDAKHDEFMPLILVKLAKISMDQASALSDL